MNLNAYQIISELLIPGPVVNADMLITKPSLFIYIQNEKIDDTIANGITSFDKQLHAYFVRIPEKSESYQEFIRQYSPIRIMVSKLKNIKDQAIKILPINLPEYQNSLTEDDIKKICKNTELFTPFFNRGDSIDKIPHAIISTSSGVIPAFCLKALTPEKRLVG